MRPIDDRATTPRGGILPANWFAFAAGWALRSAFRRREYISLISIGVCRECIGWNVVVGRDQCVELTTAIAPMLRETDIFGELTDDRFGILLADADDVAGCWVIQRIGEALASVRFSMPLMFAIGAGTCPTHGVDVPTLVTHAVSHPVLSLRPRFSAVAPLAEHCETPRQFHHVLRRRERQA